MGNLVKKMEKKFAVKAANKEVNKAIAYVFKEL